MSMQMDYLLNLVIFQVHNQLEHSFEVYLNYIELNDEDVLVQNNASHKLANDV